MRGKWTYPPLSTPIPFQLNLIHRLSLSRYPYSTTFRTVNRVCSSSLQSLTDIAFSIQSGTINMGIAAGAESMTKDYGVCACTATQTFMVSLFFLL